MATVNPYADSNAAIARDTSDLQGDNSRCTEYRGHFDYTLSGSNNNEYYGDYVRFGIPDITQGATINHAYMYFTVSAKSSGTCYVRVYAEDTADASLPNNLDDFTSGGKTSAYKEYNFSSLTNGDTYYLDVTDIVQEIVNKDFWAAGNHINIELTEYSADLNAYTDFKTSDCHLDIDYTNVVSVPTVTTGDHNEGSDYAYLYGDVTDTGGEDPTRRIDYGLDTSYGSTCNAGTGGTGNYDCYVDGLNPNTLYHYRAEAENSSGTGFGDDATFTTTANLPAVSTDTNSPSDTSAILYGKVTDTGGQDPDRYMEWGTSTDYGYACDAGTGGTGTYSCQATSLTANTTYHYRAKVHNSGGWAYGDDATFTTTPSAPTVTTGDHSEGGTYATLYGDITDTGGENPTRHIEYGTSTDYGNDCNAGTGGTGSYSCYIDGLSTNTTYHYRAWASNSGGDGNGNDATFTTTVNPPTVTTQAVTYIKKLTAVGNGTITDDGGDATTKGICWNTTGTPTTSDSHATNGTGTGAYTVSITDLAGDQLYYVRAYGTNSGGTGYGDQVTFTTDYATLKRYNGSSWVTAPLKTYNGSSWVDKPLKIYEGSWKDVETL